MKSMTHTKRMKQPLHIETDGCIVNIYTGLHTEEGIPVTAIHVQCDDYAGEEWRVADDPLRGRRNVNLRIVKQTPTPPTTETPPSDA